MASVDIAEALAFLDSCRFWSLSARAISCSWQAPRPRSQAEAEAWQPIVRSAARRKPGESLEQMICRLAALAAERRSTGWKNPGFIGAGTNCAGCGRPSRLEALRLDRRLKLPLCQACRQGLETRLPKTATDCSRTEQ